MSVYYLNYYDDYIQLANFAELIIVYSQNIDISLLRDYTGEYSPLICLRSHGHSPANSADSALKKCYSIKINKMTGQCTISKDDMDALYRHTLGIIDLADFCAKDSSRHGGDGKISMLRQIAKKAKKWIIDIITTSGLHQR